MPTILLTARTVAGLKPQSHQVDYFDQALPGLALRVSQAGRKCWTVLYRHQRRLRRLTIGVYPNLTLADARVQARRTLRDVSLGGDPAGLKRDALEAPTFGDLAGLYIEKHAKPKKKSWKEDQRIIDTELLPHWKHVKAAAVRRADVRILLEGIAERPAPIMANRTLALVRKIFNFALGRELVDMNPCSQLERPAPSAQRDRVLTEEEIRRLWKALDAKPAEMAAAFKLRLLTAQRGGEVVNMRWRDVDLDAGWWTIPAEDSKNKLLHRVPLSTPVVAILRALQVSSKPDALYVVAGARGKRQRGEAARDLGVRDFVGHDLRRTAASMMASGGVPRLVIAKILNHVEMGVTAVYDRHSYDAEKRAALAWWAAHLQGVLAPRRATEPLPFTSREGWQSRPSGVA